MSIGERTRALRTRLKLTGEQLADLSGLRRVDVVRVENGQNQGTSHNIRAGLARGFGLGLEDASAYFDGEMDLEEALRRIRAQSPPTIRRTRRHLALAAGAKTAPPDRTVELDARYQNAIEALENRRRRGDLLPAVEAEIRSMAMHRGDDLDVETWATNIADITRRIRREEKDAGSAKAHPYVETDNDTPPFGKGDE